MTSLKDVPAFGGMVWSDGKETFTHDNITIDMTFDAGLRRHNGMTFRQYAAVKLRVPDSGDDWLDGMIRTANRRDAAVHVLQGLLAHYGGSKSELEYADALIKQLEVGDA